MAVTLNLPNDVVERLSANAAARGLTLEQLAEETLAQVPAIDADVANLLAHTVAEHRETLDRLATT